MKQSKRKRVRRFNNILKSKHKNLEDAFRQVQVYIVLNSKIKHQCDGRKPIMFRSSVFTLAIQQMSPQLLYFIDEIKLHLKILVPTGRSS
jgi:hypothetical protein